MSVARFVAGRLPSARDPGGIYITPEQDVRSVRTAPLEDRHRLLIITGEHFTPGARHVTERWERQKVTAARKSLRGSGTTWAGRARAAAVEEVVSDHVAE